MKGYSCGECGNEELIIIGGDESWVIRCGNGHPLIPHRGFRLELQLQQNEGAIVVPHVTRVKITLPRDDV